MGRTGEACDNRLISSTLLSAGTGHCGSQTHKLNFQARGDAWVGGRSAGWQERAKVRAAGAPHCTDLTKCTRTCTEMATHFSSESFFEADGSVFCEPACGLKLSHSNISNPTNHIRCI